MYVREDIPSKLLTKHKFTKNVEGLFIEINLRKCKLLFLASYRSDHPIHGLSPDDYFEQLTLALDVYSNYDKFLLAGDLNIEADDSRMKEFLFEHNARNLVNEMICFKSMDNPSCIDLFFYQLFSEFSTYHSDKHRSVRFS